MISPILALLCAIIVSVASGGRIIRLLTGLRVRQTVSEDAPERHRQKQGTPTMGGVIIFLGAVAGTVVGILARPDVSDDGLRRLVPVVFVTLACAGIGFLDDFLIVMRGKNLGLKARQKLALQFLGAVVFVVWICSVRRGDPTAVHLWGGEPLHFGWIYYPLAVLLVVGMSNAVNLTDGLDGLAGGLSSLAFLTMGALALGALGVNISLVIFAWAVAGGCLGFLWFNKNPARVFMGDVGSLALGGALAALGIAARQELLVVAVGAIFVIEALSVMIQVASFKATGKRVFRMTPIHHHFELSGWPEKVIVKRFWTTQLVLSALVLVFFRLLSR